MQAYDDYLFWLYWYWMSLKCLIFSFLKYVQHLMNIVLCVVNLLKWILCSALSASVIIMGMSDLGFDQQQLLSSKIPCSSQWLHHTRIVKIHRVSDVQKFWKSYFRYIWYHDTEDHYCHAIMLFIAWVLIVMMSWLSWYLLVCSSIINGGKTMIWIVFQPYCILCSTVESPIVDTPK
jgi:hypothetical protein